MLIATTAIQATHWEFHFDTKRRALLGTAAWRDWAQRMLSEGRTAAWYRDNVVWVDICAKAIPGSPAKALDQEMAAKNKKKRHISPGSTASSVSVGGSSTADKQCGSGGTHVLSWWRSPAASSVSMCYPSRVSVLARPQRAPGCW